MGNALKHENNCLLSFQSQPRFVKYPTKVAVKD